MTHRDECTLCKQYAKHAVAVLEKLTVEIPSHWIELAFWMAWPRMVACIEEDAVDEAHGKLSWYCNRYQDVIINTKVLQEQFNSEKERGRKAESELHHLRKEGKDKGKWREVSATHKWCEWESTTDSDVAEQMLSKTSRKQRCCDTGPPDVPPG